MLSYQSARRHRSEASIFNKGLKSYKSTTATCRAAAAADVESSMHQSVKWWPPRIHRPRRSKYGGQASGVLESFVALPLHFAMPAQHISSRQCLFVICLDLKTSQGACFRLAHTDYSPNPYLEKFWYHHIKQCILGLRFLKILAPAIQHVMSLSKNWFTTSRKCNFQIRFPP